MCLYCYLLTFSDMQASSPKNSTTDRSHGFCLEASNVFKKAKENLSDSEAIPLSSSLIDMNVSPVKSSDSSGNIFSALLAADSISDLENAYNNKDKRRDPPQHATKLTDTNILISPTDSDNIFLMFSPKRSHLTSDSGASTSKEQMPKTSRQKKLSIRQQT